MLELLLWVVIPGLAALAWTSADDAAKTGLLTGNELTRPATDPVYGLFSCDADTALAVHLHGQIELWSLSQERCVSELHSRLRDVHSAAYSHRQHLLALASHSGQVEVWDLSQPDQPLATTVTETALDIVACRFSPDGRQLCGAGEMGQLLFWDSRTLEQQFKLCDDRATGTIRSVEYTADGQQVVAGTVRGTACVWDLANRSLINTVDLTPSLDCFLVHRGDATIEAVLPLPEQGKWLLVTRAAGIWIWNLREGRGHRLIGEDGTMVHAASLIGGGERFATGNFRGEICVWETATGRLLKRQFRHSHYIRSLTCNPAGTVVVSADCAGEIRCIADFAQ